jgi:uncharacterized protein YjbI with pentapeptide repeats
MTKMTPEDLQYHIEQHGKWLKNNRKGEYFYLEKIWKNYSGMYILNDFDFSNADLSRSYIANFTFHNCVFKNTNFSKATFNNLIFVNCDFTNAILTDVDLSSCEFVNNINLVKKETV